MNPDQATDSPEPHRWYRIWGEIAGAWAISLAYPVYTKIASGPEALTALGLRRLDVLVLIFVVSLLGPLLITLAELGIRKLFGERVRRIVQGLVVGALLSLVIWQWLLDHGSPGFLRNLLPLAFALLVAWLYVRTELIRNFALMLSFATVVVIGAFAIDYPIKDELLPHKAAASTAKVDADTPVVMVIFDELPLAALEKPDGKIDPRFRNFAMLARKANWYSDAVSVADQTTFALPSILTGQDPNPTGGNHPPSPSLANYPNSICQIAENGGYEVHAYEPVTDLCHRSWDMGTRITGTIRRAISADNPIYQDEIAPSELDRRAARAAGSFFRKPYSEIDEGRREAFNEFIDGLPSDSRSLSVLHITLPHVMWIYSPDGSQYEDFRPAADTLLTNPSTEGEVERNAQQMMLQLQFTDRELGKLIRKMKADGTWDESLFIVTADHGAAFHKDGSRRILDSTNEGWIMPVPLFIKYPGQTKGKVVRGKANGLDIAPTVMSTLGLDPLPDMHGRDLTGVSKLPRTKSIEMVGTIGGRTSIGLARVRKEQKQASSFMNRLLGRSFFAPGGYANLLGRRPSGMTEVAYTATDPTLYENVDRSSGFIPAYFQAGLSVPGNRYPGTMAIALNGRIVATGRPWKYDGQWYSGVVLPAEKFRDGSNEIRVYRVNPEKAASPQTR